MTTSLVARWRNWWDKVHDGHSDYLEQIPARWTGAAVLLASALTLYVEMVMVRWHASCFHAFAIFKNVSLLSCFLGLGIGYGLSGRRLSAIGRRPETEGQPAADSRQPTADSRQPTAGSRQPIAGSRQPTADGRQRRISLASFLPLLALQVVLFGVLSNTNLGGRRINPVAEQLVMGTASYKWSILQAIEGNLFLAVVFVLNALMFIPLGQLAGRLMQPLPKIQAYSLNLLGSLLGIGLFFLLSLAWTGPEVWLGVAILGLAPFLFGQRGGVAVTAACLALILVGLGGLGDRREQQYFSPYQLIALRLPHPQDAVPTPTIRVNHCFFQDIFDCSPTAVARRPENAKAARYYDLPYRLRGQAPTANLHLQGEGRVRGPGSVLVVGAGTGNDVAAALRHQAEAVTAVEIDPAVLFLGQSLHPERPYQDQRTQTVVNDARTFLRQTDQRFDTVIYALLDSHTNLGALTNVRLDSFVYTVEGFREAVRCLKEDGLLIVSYLTLHPRQGERLYAMLQQAYPARLPRAFDGGAYNSTTFVTGPGLERLPAHIEGVQERSAQFLSTAGSVEVATDDWPFFYMQERTYPLSYAATILLLLALSAWLVRKNLGSWHLRQPRQGVFFFLGAGFMLIETKGITELGLVFGNTWSVVAVVVSGILMMVYLANRWVQRRGPVGPWRSFAWLAGSLLLGLAVTQLNTTGVAIPFPRLVMPLVLTLPLFFAGLVFSSELASGGDLGTALSANLLGGMLGGFLEYNSMYFGYRSLYPLGMVLYGLAFLCLWWEQRRRAAESPPPSSQPESLAA